MEQSAKGRDPSHLKGLRTSNLAGCHLDPLGVLELVIEEIKDHQFGPGVFLKRNPAFVFQVVYATAAGSYSLARLRGYIRLSSEQAIQILPGKYHQELFRALQYTKVGL